MQQFGMPQFNLLHHSHRLALSVVVLSVIIQIFSPVLPNLLAFIPNDTLFKFHVWRPFTGLPIARSPLEIIFGGLIIYSLGSTLEQALGRKRFLYLALGLPLVGNIATLAVALLFPASVGFIPYFGAGSIVSTLWVLFGLRMERSGYPLNFWGIPLKGRTFALIGLGFVVLQGLFSSFAFVIPDLTAALLAYLYMYDGGYRRIWSDITNSYYSWKLKRLKAKRGMHVVTGQRQKPKGDYSIH